MYKRQVAIGCQNLIDPYACKKIIEDLEVLVEQLGIDDINDLVGRSHKFWVKKLLKK